MNIPVALPVLALYGVIMAGVSLLRGRRSAAVVFGILAVGSTAIAVALSYAPHTV